MEEVKSRIKSYALIIDSSLSEEDILLDFAIDSIVDRFLIYTNRFNLDEEEQVPLVIERVLANSVVGTFKSIKDYHMSITSASDNGQTVSFGTELSTYFASKSDAEVFMGSTELFNKFRLAKVIP